jgi:hypothetical protein
MKVSDAQDIRQALIKEVEALPDDVLPKVYKLVKLVSDRQVEVAEVIRRAQRIAEGRKDWSREQHLARLLEVADELRQEALQKGIGVDDEREACRDT